MVGIVVMGHDHFAEGIGSSLEMLIGKAEGLELVNFFQDDSMDELTDKLKVALQKLSDCTGILVYADLVGGTPFNIAIRTKMQGNKEMEVIGGANVAAVLYGYMLRAKEQNISVIAKESVTAGKEAMLRFEVAPDVSEDYEE